MWVLGLNCAEKVRGGFVTSSHVDPEDFLVALFF